MSVPDTSNSTIPDAQRDFSPKMIQSLTGANHAGSSFEEMTINGIVPFSFLLLIQTPGSHFGKIMKASMLIPK